MSYFNACILITRNGLNSEQMADKASDMLAKFNINKKMEPYKIYIEADEIQQMAKHHEIDPVNLLALAEKLEDWNGDKGNVDESGLYGISTKNPEGHIDGWSVFTEVKPEDRGRLLFGESSEEKNCAAIVTPDGKWDMGPWFYFSPNAEQKKELEAWNRKLIAFLDEHKNSAIFLAECHI